MEGTTTSGLSTRIVGRTEVHLETINECVQLLSELVENYATGEQHRHLVEEIRTLESECDARNRQISSLITNSGVDEFGIRNTRVHLNSEQVVRLYQRLDEIPNTAEQIAEALVTINPPGAGAYFRRYQEMVDYATTAMTALRAAVHEFVYLLCSSTESGTITDHVAAVRTAETGCDGVRNAVVSDAFGDASCSEPMIHREFANLFDLLLDTMEDVTDQLVLLSSSEEWITVEPERT